MVALVLLAGPLAGTAAAQAPTVDYGPDVLVISQPVLAALEKGLRTEIALREGLRRELAAMKTAAQYDRCKLETATSPESMKLFESLTTMPDDVARDEYQRRMLKAGKAMEAFVLKKCGADPVAFGDSWRAARLAVIERKAAAAAGPLP